MIATVAAWTGVETSGCPWRAMNDPFVMRVFDLYRLYDKGQLGFFYPNLSARELEGVQFLASLFNLIDAQALELERKEREANRHD